MHFHVVQAPVIDVVIDVALVIAVAESQGYVSPERARALEEQAARTQADLDRLRREDPDWAAEVDAAVRAFNASDPAAALDAFARLDDLIDESRARLLAREAELRLEAARSKHAQATLVYPHLASKAEPLLAAAAELAGSRAWYWLDCARARVALGRLGPALTALERALSIARQGDCERDIAAALCDIGDVRTAQGDLPGALTAYAESRGIARDLAARDAGNAGWARDLWVSYWKMATVDPENAAAHWSEVVARIEDMAARGVLPPADAAYLDAARARLAEARNAAPAAPR